MKRKVFELGDDQAESWDRLVADLDETQVGVFRDSFRVMREAVRAARSGGRLAILGPDNGVTLLSGPWDDLRPTG